MRGSVIKQLVRKDWLLHLPLILPCIGVGLVALLILQIGGEVAGVLGSVWFFIAMIITASMLPMSAIVNERKKQTLAFVMSLPVSSIQHTAAKLISTIFIFFVPWLILVAGAVIMIEVRHVLPHGVIPIALILAMLPWIGLSLITAFALVGETEGWAIAGTVICNSSYGFVWYFLSRFSSVMGDVKSPVVVWSPVALMILGGEFLTILLLLGVTFYLQSRKRDFV
jgi:hypothetical protein